MPRMATMILHRISKILNLTHLYLNYLGLKYINHKDTNQSSKERRTIERELETFKLYQTLAGMIYMSKCKGVTKFYFQPCQSLASKCCSLQCQ